MDRRTLANNLNHAFCNKEEQINKKYAQVWLSHVDFGGLYYTDKYYVLNVMPKNKIDHYTVEIKEVFDFLKEHAKDELKHILKIKVCPFDDNFYCTQGDLMVYSENKAC